MLNLRSEKNLMGVDERLVKVVRKIAEDHEILVIEGLRTKERQEQLYAQGRTKPGPIVTWTLESKHLDGLAVDVVMPVDGKIDWNNANSFVEVGFLMMNAAKELGVALRWGYDWDGDLKLREKGENDGPHFELM